MSAYRIDLMAIVRLSKTAWDFLYSQRAEATWGLIWALAIWLVFDLLRLGSYARACQKQARRKLQLPASQTNHGA